jgi:hypothetical protein
MKRPPPLSLQVAADMPFRSHWPDLSKPFHPSRSQVIQWLLAQPSIQQWVFEKAKRHGFIAYHRSRGQWAGTDYAPAPKPKDNEL